MKCDGIQYVLYYIINIMLSYLNYNLSEYQDFRTLEFNYSKLKDQNEQLKAKLMRLQKIYGETVDENKDLRHLQQIKLERIKLRQQAEEINKQKTSRQDKQESSKIKKTTISLNLNAVGQKIKKSKNFPQWSELMKLMEQGPQMSEQCAQLVMGLMNNWLKMDKKIQTLQHKINQKLANKTKMQGQRQQREQELLRQINQLQGHIQKLQSLRLDTASENNFLKQQINQLQIRINAIQNMTKNNLINHQHQQDKSSDQEINDQNFALEFLNFQKQLLRRIFTNLISSMVNQQLGSCFRQIYQAYQNIVQSYKEKLQIEYDLEDLECAYKRDKKHYNSSSLLIQMRKKIQEFRAELNKQNQYFYEKEKHLEKKIKEFHLEQLHQNKLRQYNVEIQKRLINTQKHHSSQISVMAASKHEHRVEHSLRQKKLQNDDDLMNEFIKRDRQNLEKILKQTRNKYLNRQ